VRFRFSSQNPRHEKILDDTEASYIVILNLIATLSFLYHKPEQERPIAKAGAKTKAETVRKKAREQELAKERRRAGRSGQKVPSSDPRRGEKQRPSPGR
jgi:hypothetical protein